MSKSTKYRIGAVVLAGGGMPASLEHLCAYRALLRVNNRYLLDYLLQTLQVAPSIAAFALVAPAEVLGELSALPGYRASTGDSLVENMRRGACALAEQRLTHLLYVTADIPLLTVAGVEDYIATSLECGASLTYPIIPRQACEKRFPGAKRTYVRLREDTFTGGNAIFTTESLLNDKQALIQDLYAARKQPFKLAQLLGWSTVVRLLTGTLTLPYLEVVASRLLRAPARAIITPYAEIGFDVDKLSDLLQVERELAEQTADTQ